MTESKNYLEIVVRFTFALVIVCGCITLVRIGLCSLASTIASLNLPWLIASTILAAAVLVFLLPKMTHLVAIVPASYILRYDKPIIWLFWLLIIVCIAFNMVVVWNKLIVEQGVAAIIVCLAAFITFVLWAGTIPAELIKDKETEDLMQPKPGSPVSLYDLCNIHGKERYCIGSKDAHRLAPLIGIEPEEIDDCIEVLIMRLQLDYDTWKSEYGSEHSEFSDYWQATEFRRQMSIPNLSDTAVRAIYEKDLIEYEKYRQQAQEYAATNVGNKPPYYDYWCKRDGLIKS